MASLLLKLQSRHLDFRTLDTSIDQEPLLVIGVGLGRTGTMSLRKALQILYNKPCYHMAEIILRHQDHIPRWIEIFKQCRENSVDSIDPDELKDIFKGHAMADGHPACCVYEKLIEIYPDAKIILTTRDSHDWLESYRETIGQAIPRTGHTRYTKFIDSLIIGSEFRTMAALSMQCALGWNLDFANDEAVIQAYEDRNQAIRNRVPPERLLCFNVKEGWEPLCQFLNLPTPDQSFPHVNGREEMQSRLKTMERLKTILTWGLPTLCVVAIGLTVTYFTRI